MNKHMPLRDTSVPQDWDRRGLPNWCYHSDAFLELEKEHLFLNHWQLICHVSDVPENGDYLTMDVCDERALILRDKEGVVRAFYNLCRHRGSRVVANEKGHCKSALVCPFHGWVYNLDGTLRGAAQPKSFPDLDKHEFGLKPLELEIWNGLIYVRFNKGPQPSVAELMAPFEMEIAPYKLDKMIPTEGFWTNRSSYNWKSARDVDNEGYHVAMAHPALQDLYGQNYKDEPYVNGTSRTTAVCNPGGGSRWSVRHYLKATQPQSFHPPELHKAWNYYGLFPNVVIAVTPESMQFYQEFPTSTGETLQRGAVYRYAEETREQRTARYLAYRIDRETVEEDMNLSIWSNESMLSRGSTGFYLSDLEYGLRTHHDHIRQQLPISKLYDQPEESQVRALNRELAAQEM